MTEFINLNQEIPKPAMEIALVNPKEEPNERELVKEALNIGNHNTSALIEKATLKDPIELN